MHLPRWACGSPPRSWEELQGKKKPASSHRLKTSVVKHRWRAGEFSSTPNLLLPPNVFHFDHRGARRLDLEHVVLRHGDRRHFGESPAPMATIVHFQGDKTERPEGPFSAPRPESREGAPSG